jgi:hypothetical protein
MGRMGRMAPKSSRVPRDADPTSPLPRPQPLPPLPPHATPLIVLRRIPARRIVLRLIVARPGSCSRISKNAALDTAANLRIASTSHSVSPTHRTCSHVWPHFLKCGNTIPIRRNPPPPPPPKIEILCPQIANGCGLERRAHRFPLRNAPRSQNGDCGPVPVPLLLQPHISFSP